MDPRDAIVVRFEVAAEQLERAAEHAHAAAKHFRERDVPAGCAHKVSIEGHLLRVRDELEAIARFHAEHSEP
ncbi:MAG: hypothetical protein GY898_26730 [Proteobacteria bacterium]|nr:hypothetical protein [Pseudomonadota bacterium]